MLQFGHVARMELQRLLAELVGRHAQEQIIDMATVVDLEAYENADFHDRLQRAQMAANFRPLNLTMTPLMATNQPSVVTEVIHHSLSSGVLLPRRPKGLRRIG